MDRKGLQELREKVKIAENLIFCINEYNYALDRIKKEKATFFVPHLAQLVDSEQVVENIRGILTLYFHNKLDEYQKQFDEL